MAGHILDLPDEVLQLIGESVSLDPTILRLVCKRFDAVFLDLYAEEYLSDLHCCVLDPQRLNRLDLITGQAHLLCRIKTVNFNLTPFEGKFVEDIPSVLVEDDDEQMMDGRSVTAKQIQDEYYDQWLERPQLELYVLEDILARLQTVTRSRVALSLTNGDSVFERRPHPRRVPIISDSTLAMVFHVFVRSDCVLSKLDLSDTRFLAIWTCREAQWYKCLQNLGSGLETLHLTPQEDDIERLLQEPGEDIIAKAYRWPLTHLLRGAESLRSLRISAPFCPARKYDGIQQERRYHQFARYMDVVFDHDLYYFEHLESLTLFGVDCSPDTLYGLLLHSQGTLRRLDFMGVCLHSSRRNVWLNMFNYLRSNCRKLANVSLDFLQEQTQLVVDAADTHMSYADLLAPEPSRAFDSEDRYAHELKLIDRDEVERGLAENIDCGLPFVQH